MDVTLTTRCNNNCYFCPRHAYLKTVTCRTDEERYSDIRNTRNAGDRIVLSGGEITILRELWKIIDLCKKINFRQVCIVTNGRRLKDFDFARRMVFSGVTDFAVSLYSTDEKIHDSITRSRGSCKETKQGIANLLCLAADFGINLRVNFVLSHRNIADLAESVSEVFSWGIKNFIIAEQIIIGNNPEHLKLQEIADFLDDFVQIKLNGARICLRGFPLCLFKREKLVAGSGSVIKQRNPFIILERQEVDTLVKSKKQKLEYFQEFKRLFTYTQKCRSCSYKQRCPGVQKAYLWDID